MTQLSELIHENEILKRKLEVCRVWMQRQIDESLGEIIKKRIHAEGKKHIDSFFADNILDSQGHKIQSYFSDTFFVAPKYTLERLIDGEIYWYTLQKHPKLDGIALTIGYQKILDDVFSLFTGKIQKCTIHTVEQLGIDRDIVRVFEKGYTLSLGRWYLIASLLRSGSDVSPLVRRFLEVLEEVFPGFSGFLVSDNFFVPFQALIEIGVFQEKRHGAKVSYADAKRTRDIVTGDGYMREGLLKTCFLFLGSYSE